MGTADGTLLIGSSLSPFHGKKAKLLYVLGTMRFWPRNTRQPQTTFSLSLSPLQITLVVRVILCRLNLKLCWLINGRLVAGHTDNLGESQMVETYYAKFEARERL